ncbi:54.9 kDa protein [Human adenovirus 14]|uniref:E1B 55 kDa protein n=3 Tax=Human mastadenovirus B TaxID=108098 RepID=I3PVB5_9ADEN|nr:E1B [Human adenovirus 14]AXY66467.1 54.9 kDa protein [Human mastadenovirus B]AFK92955.1 55 kDa protein [Human adenovirus 14]AGE46413.2 54.9 kDa protein [Human adenovirus 14]AVZ45712.1 55 kDa protein [Human adenovirus 14]
MDPADSFQQGIRFGFRSHSIVENMEGSQDEDNLRLLASAAFGCSGNPEASTGHASGSGGGTARGQPESRPGPSSGGGGVADLSPELQRVLTGSTSTGRDRGVKRERASSGTDARSELALSLMSRRRPETIWWHEVQKEGRDEVSVLQEKYSLEQVKTCWLEPEDDWEVAIKNYAKIALRPDKQYKITRRINIRNACYISGNGAEVVIDTPDKTVIRCCMMDMWPGVVGMEAVTFVNVKFRGDGYNGIVFMANTKLILHGCSFFGFNNTCVDAWGQVSVRGCSFYACWIATAGRTKSQLSLKKCIFQRCNLGILNEGEARVRHCASTDTGCFILIKGNASVKHNMICGASDERPYQMLTCAGGHCNMLATVHIVSHQRKKWPVFDHNVLTKCTMHAGGRRGMFMPYQCNMNHVKVLLEPDAFSRMSLTGMFDMNMQIWKILRYDDARSRVRACECGGKHARFQPVCVDVTEDLRPDHLVIARTGAEFGSSGEETD